jgi:hypothetical protein
MVDPIASTARVKGATRHCVIGSADPRHVPLRLTPGAYEGSGQVWIRAPVVPPGYRIQPRSERGDQDWSGARISSGQ